MISTLQNTFAVAVFALVALSPITAEDSKPKDEDVPKMRELESGLVIEDLKIGDGDEAKKGTKL